MTGLVTVLAETPGSTVAGIIAAIAGLITALVGLPAAVVVLMSLRKQVAVVHKIVNQNHTDMLNFQRALVRQIHSLGVKPVEDQSLPHIEPEPEPRNEYLPRNEPLPPNEPDPPHR